LAWPPFFGIKESERTPRSMKRHLITVLKKFVSPGERDALDNLAVEHRIARYHREGLRQIREKSLSKPGKINLGCGPFSKPGFLNVDLFPGGDLTLDLRQGLPFESDSCSLIFSEHFFEHIDYPEPAGYLLRECLRVLEPGGVVRLSVPDTEWPLLDYQGGLKAPYFLYMKEHASWHPSYCTTRLEHINYHFRQNGEHRFAYDEETLRKILDAAGFTEIKRVDVDPQLDSKHRQIGSLLVSARKPVAVK
jgi:predicted SAM-dependent methyltransferase